MQELILVNEQDEAIGTMEKMEAHRKGILHRAFSIFVFDDQKQMLLQRRALNKYHSGGLWTNACCSHPVPGEDTDQAAHRRLREEMGFDTPLLPLFSFIYRAELSNHLIEHELDHVFIGHYDGHIEVNPEEVMEYRWIDLPALKKLVQHSPEHFTVWFLKIYEQVLSRPEFQ